MTEQERMFKNESVEDILLHFAPRIPYPTIDRMYVKYNFEVVADGKLLRTYQQLIKEGKLVENKKTLPEKGQNWKEPDFVTEKRYSFE
ncbi:immunity protein [Pseudomonas protegens]|uniref:Immunity protein n=1 Tax=Pseudomonas protegens TaxID=380021 RepID=A0A2T6GAV3_9PSED|nr:immunity protein [Pseudomonas protegens]PUA41272.1 immunity protein [Pseudomonas protegens]